MNLENLIILRKTQDDYSLRKEKAYLQVKKLKLEKAKLVAQYNQLIKEAEAYANLNLGEEPICQHDIILDVNDAKHTYDIGICVCCKEEFEPMHEHYSWQDKRLIHLAEFYNKKERMALAQEAYLYLEDLYHDNPCITVDEARVLIQEHVSRRNRKRRKK